MVAAPEQRIPGFGCLLCSGSATDAVGDYSQLGDTDGSRDCHEDSSADSGDEKRHSQRQRPGEPEVLDSHRVLVLEDENNHQSQQRKGNYGRGPDNTGPGDVLPGIAGRDRP